MAEARKIVKVKLPRTGLPFWFEIKTSKDGWSITPALNPKLKFFMQPQVK